MKDENLTMLFMSGVTIFIFISLIMLLFIVGCAQKPKEQPNPEPAADLPPNKSICEMGFGCELIIDSNGVKYGRPLWVKAFMVLGIKLDLTHTETDCRITRLLKLV